MQGGGSSNMTTKVIKVVLVDKHQMVRAGLRHLIEQQPHMQVVAESNDSRSALEQVKEHVPDLVLLDIPDENRLNAVRQILANYPGTKVIALSSDPAPALIEDALEAGVSGYVLKENAFEEVIRAIQAAMAGKLYLCPESTTALMRNRQQKTADAAPDKRLSEREKLLLRLVADGLHNKEIASLLEVTTKSVETYRARLQKKLNCVSTAGLIRYSIREKIVVA